MSFDHVARGYAAMEHVAFGAALQRARVAMLEDVRDAKRALIIGEGDGRFLRELLRVSKSVQVDCVDSSASMLALARARLDPVDASRVSFHVQDALTWEPNSGRYDLVVTHFFLDCLDRRALTVMVDKLSALSEPRATWLLADFTIPSGWRRWHARAWISLLYGFFRIVTGLRTRTLVDPAPLLEAHGYRRTRWIESRLGMLCSATWRREPAGS